MYSHVSLWMNLFIYPKEMHSNTSLIIDPLVLFCFLLWEYQWHAVFLTISYCMSKYFPGIMKNGDSDIWIFYIWTHSRILGLPSCASLTPKAKPCWSLLCVSLYHWFDFRGCHFCNLISAMPFSPALRFYLLPYRLLVTQEPPISFQAVCSLSNLSPHFTEFIFLWI